jgi:hypothetical protein
MFKYATFTISGMGVAPFRIPIPASIDGRRFGAVARNPFW